MENIVKNSNNMAIEQQNCNFRSFKYARANQMFYGSEGTNVKTEGRSKLIMVFQCTV